ncbi:hypothetical protein [Cupriavidus agavae]
MQHPLLRFPHARRWAAALLLAATMSGCATLAPVNTGLKLVGQPQSAVQATFGKPTDVYQLADGTTRWFYSEQPLGEYSYAADFDREGRLTNFRQMLTTAELYKAKINVWTKQDVLEHFGAPREPNQYYPRLKREAWSYRFLHEDQWYSMFNFMFDDAGVLRQTLITPDPLRDRAERD